MIEIQIILQKLEGEKEELRKSLKKRKEMAIQKNDTLYKEINIDLKVEILVIVMQK